jgi:hypothetical protein
MAEETDEAERDEDAPRSAAMAREKLSDLV